MVHAEARAYIFYHQECQHSTEIQIEGNFGAGKALPTVTIASLDYCTPCLMGMLPYALLSHCEIRRRFPPSPRTDDIRRRTEGIWKQLVENRKIVDPNDLQAFRAFLPRDIDFLNVLLQDIDEDLYYRWTNRELHGVKQPTFVETQLFLQLRHCVQQGIIAQLEEKDFPAPENPSVDANWVIPMPQSRTILTAADFDTLGDTFGEKTCFCGKDFEKAGRPWCGVTSDAMPVRLGCCERLMCLTCALKAIDVKPVLDVRPCQFCGANLTPDELQVAPVSEAELLRNPSPQWMDVFRPRE